MASSRRSDRQRETAPATVHALASAVFEEFIHTAQHRTGMVDDLIARYGNAEAERLLEIQAAEKLITNRQAYGISNDATRATIERLRTLRAGGQ